MNTVASLNLLGVEMSGIDTPDRCFIWTDIPGWDGLTDLRGQGDPIPGNDGSFPRSVGYRESRAITVTGHIYCASNSELVVARAELEAALSATFGDLTVTTTNYGMWSRSVQIQNVVIPPDRGRKTVPFTVDMVAADPRRYRAVQRVGPVSEPILVGGVRFPQRAPWNFGSSSAGGTLTILNDGSVPVLPVVEVVGSFGSVAVRNITSGRELRLDWPVDGQVRFDCGARRATADGGIVTRFMDLRQWFEIMPGETARLRVTADVPVEMFAEFRIGAW